MAIKKITDLKTISEDLDDDNTRWLFLYTGERRVQSGTAGIPRRDENGNLSKDANGNILFDKLDLSNHYTIKIETVRHWTTTRVSGETLNVKFSERFKGDAVRELPVTVSPGQDQEATKGKFTFIIPEDLMNDVTIETASDTLPVAEGFVTVTNTAGNTTILKNKFLIFYREGIAKDNI